ncbi:MAG: hypothetical protein ACI8TX_002484 [Hyphomicrobiaceae bacterium]|jgi:hypothetical protein
MLVHRQIAVAMLAAVSISVFGVVSAQAGRPDTRPPSRAERQWIAKLKVGLQRSAASMPIPVTNTLESLERTLAWGFDCPVGTRLKRVNMLVSTEHVSWDPRLAGRHGSAGTYYWGVRLYSMSGVATLTADNWVMLNPASLEYEAGKGKGGEAINEGLLYHELLHGELLILTTSTSAWKRKACNLELDLDRNDGDHRDIDPAVDIYLENRSRLLQNAAAG